ncbi:MAG: aminotransferase class IV [Crocinitomicaceae bacterium]|jgi:branched-subunit amino acid aminotransferase/4-amino-4-deoxychorismate lyase|nr:aminotransferase class IV [Crocinitomicaceae bacterium]MDG1658244.1 aminotransferase class IV [Crocinitomicaceae bacterium]MDG2440067.1 aminotransferase class IV [Crocinitomicaceae bacterium]
MLYINNNGDILPSDSYVIRAGNRGHMYGDGVFESIRIFDGKPINMGNHVKRMLEGATKIKMRPPSYFDEAFFADKIQELLDKSNIKEGGKCRISLDRSRGGTYLPEVNEVEFLIEVYPLELNRFELNPKGKEIDIYMEHKKDKSSLSNFKTKNGLLYVLAAIAAKEKGLDDYLIANFQGGILESTNSNLFVVSNGVLYTPGLEEGCLAGTMRMQIINLAIKNGIKVYECNILPQNLLVADEIFLTNAISGITWASGYRTKRYFNTISRRMIGLLNDSWARPRQH